MKTVNYIDSTYGLQPEAEYIRLNCLPAPTSCCRHGSYVALSGVLGTTVASRGRRQAKLLGRYFLGLCGCGRTPFSLVGWSGSNILISSLGKHDGELLQGQRNCHKGLKKALNEESSGFSSRTTRLDFGSSTVPCS